MAETFDNNRARQCTNNATSPRLGTGVGWVGGLVGPAALRERVEGWAEGWGWTMSGKR